MTIYFLPKLKLGSFYLKPISFNLNPIFFNLIANIGKNIHIKKLTIAKKNTGKPLPKSWKAFT